MKTIIICVDGGVATIVDETVPAGYQVEIIDYDNLREAPEYTYEQLSDEGKKFVDEHGL